MFFSMFNLFIFLLRIALKVKSSLKSDVSSSIKLSGFPQTEANSHKK